MGYRLGNYHVICGDDDGNTITEVAVSGNGMILGTGNTLDGARNLIVGRNNIISSGSDSNLIVGDNHEFEQAGSDRNLVQGFANNVSGGADFNAILGGNQTATSRYVTYIGSGNTDGYGVSYGLMSGRSNTGTMSAYYSQYISYSGTAANGYYQLITGIDASGNMGGAHTHSSGKFSTKGDAQTSYALFGCQTTNATQTTMRTMNDFENLSPKVALNQSVMFKIEIVARRTSTQTESAAYEILGCIKNDAGTTALEGTITKTVIAEADSNWDVTAVANNTDDTLDIKVTGAAGKNINWLGKLTYIATIGA
tara:strand:- start:1147 stop:2076 length:930 start_codon:yes stop_codon:yes gene_type:complete